MKAEVVSMTADNLDMEAIPPDFGRLSGVVEIF